MAAPDVIVSPQKRERKRKGASARERGRLHNDQPRSSVVPDSSTHDMMVIIITCDKLTSASASCDPVRMSDFLGSMCCTSCFPALD
jgi:hypothetical protein